MTEQLTEGQGLSGEELEATVRTHVALAISDGEWLGRRSVDGATPAALIHEARETTQKARVAAILDAQARRAIEPPPVRGEDREALTAVGRRLQAEYEAMPVGTAARDWRWREYQAVLSALSQSPARDGGVSEAVEALRPFALLADKLRGDDGSVFFGWSTYKVTLRDFRRAARALAALKATNPHPQGKPK